VTDRQGNVNDGASAFIALWRELPGLKLLARIAGSKPVLPILEVLYLLFLKLRSSR
jgi:predicted DCC family thiol-disulfide oxidoreductase YuxK